MVRMGMLHSSQVTVRLLLPYQEDFCGCFLAVPKPIEQLGCVRLTEGLFGDMGRGSDCFVLLIDFRFSPYPLLST